MAQLRSRGVYAREAVRVVEERRGVVRASRVDAPRLSFWEWANRVPEPKTGALDFERFPFQVELYQETEQIPEVVVMKATQIGVSAYLVRATMYWADVDGWTVIYIFPKLNLMWDFADARVKPLIQASPYLQGRVPRAHVQNKGLRQVGSGYVFYRGSESVDGLESIDADGLAFDEYDSLVAANVPVAERRLSGSPHGFVRRVGVPSVPGFGLDALYQKTDQRRWHVKCDHDKKWQPIFFDEGGHPDFEGEFTAFVDQEQERVVCGRCRKPLDVAHGEWVPAFPDQQVRGYHASRLIVPAVARNDRGMLTGIIAASHSPEPYIKQVHHNRDLGEAYATKEGRLSLEVLAAAQEKGYRQPAGYRGDYVVTAGIDVASVRALNVRISEHPTLTKKRALFIGQVDDFNDLAELMTRYNVQMFVIDHLPEGRLARSFCARFPGKGMLGILTGGATTKVLTVNDENGTVTVRRTEAIDSMMTMLREQRNVLPEDLPEGYVKHMQAPVRYTEKDDVGKVVVGYRSSGADDYAMAEVFDMVAMEAWRYRQQLGLLMDGEVVALEDRLEFQRAHLNEPDRAGQYSPGMPNSGYTQDSGYSPGFTGYDEPGFDSPYEAWPSE